MIGPGAVSVNTPIGQRLPVVVAFTAIGIARMASWLFLHLMRIVSDSIRKRGERVIERYMEISERMSAILIGTIAVAMITRGIDLWVGDRL